MTDFVQQHVDRVEILSTKLHEALVKGDSGAYVARTGSLLRSKTLRNLETRKVFETVMSASNQLPQNDAKKHCRFWSKRTMLDALKKW